MDRLLRKSNFEISAASDGNTGIVPFEIASLPVVDVDSLPLQNLSVSKASDVANTQERTNGSSPGKKVRPSSLNSSEKTS